MPVIVTRSSNNFGPYQHPEKMIPLFITNALEATVAWYREHEAWWRPLKSGPFTAYYERQYERR